jgi:hypothetical protein
LGSDKDTKNAITALFNDTTSFSFSPQAVMFLRIAFQTTCVSKLFSSRQVIDSSPPPGIVFIWTVMLESESIPIVCKNSRQTFTPPPADPVMCLPAAKKVSPVLTATFQNGPKQARVQGETTGSRSVGSNVERASALAIILEQQLAPRLAVFDHDFTHTPHPQTLATMSSSVSTATISMPQQTAAGLKTALTQAKEQASSTAAAADNSDDFFWTYTEEPHATRRQAIIKAHPEVHFT